MANEVNGTTGNDTIDGGAFNDIIDGGAGFDTVVLSCNLADCMIAKTSTGYTLTSDSGGTDMLTNIERLQFDDMSVNLTIQDTVAGIDSAAVQRIEELYVAFFNRVPDADGLEYWLNDFKNGASLNSIAEGFYSAGIFYSNLTGYSADMSNDDFINTVYRNVLGRQDGADPGGLAFWSAALADGTESHASLVAAILEAAHTYKGDPTWGWVPDLLDNKILVANTFAVDWGLNYNTPADSITKGMAIAAAVTPLDTGAAISMIGIQSFNPAPVLQSAIINGSLLSLTYNEALDAAHQPSASYFKVKINNNGVLWTYPISSLAVNGNTVNLTLIKPVAQTDTVTLSYTDPTTGNDTYALQDVAGNDAASLANISVVNQTVESSATPFKFGTIGFTETTNSVFTFTFYKGIQATNAMAGWHLLQNGTTPITITGASITNNTLTLQTSATLAPTDFVAIAYSGGSLADNFGNPFTGGGFSAYFLGGSGANTAELSLLPGYSSSNYWVNGAGGDDTITGGYKTDVISGGAGADTINGDGGADNIYLTEGTPATDTVIVNHDGNPIIWASQGIEKIYDFDVSNPGGINNDKLNLPSGTIAANTTQPVSGIAVGNLAKYSISGGILTFLDNNSNPVTITTGTSGNFGNAENFLAQNITAPGSTVGFAVDTDGNGNNDSLGVFQDGGPNEYDALAILPGVNGVTLSNTAGQNVVQIVDTTPPEVADSSDVSFSGTSITLNWDEDVTLTNGAAVTAYLDGSTSQLGVTNIAVSGNVTTLTVDHTLAPTDWVLVSGISGVSDYFGNISTDIHAGVIGGNGDNIINMSNSQDSLFISGGAGNDTLTASNSGCILQGGTGADTLIGGTGADTFRFNQGDSPAVQFIDNNLNSTLDAGDTFNFTGGADVVQNFSGSDNMHFDCTVNFNPINMAAPANGLTIDQRYFLVQGSLSGSTFTAGGGSDTLVVYDGDPTAGVSQTGLVIKGVSPSSLTASGNSIFHV